MERRGSLRKNEISAVGPSWTWGFPLTMTGAHVQAAVAGFLAGVAAVYLLSRSRNSSPSPAASPTSSGSKDVRASTLAQPPVLSLSKTVHTWIHGKGGNSTVNHARRPRPPSYPGFCPAGPAGLHNSTSSCGFCSCRAVPSLLSVGVPPSRSSRPSSRQWSGPAW